MDGADTAISERPARRRSLTPGAALFAFLLSTIWGGNTVALKAGLDDAPPLRIGWMRFLLGSVVVLGWALATGRDLRVRRHEWKCLAILGVLFAIQIAFMNIGQDHTTAAHGVVMTNTFPLWVGVLAHFFVSGDRLTRWKVTGALVAYAGVAVVFAGGLTVSRDHALGDASMLASAALLGARLVYTARAVENMEPAKLLLAQAAVGIAAFALVSAFVESESYRFTVVLAVSLLYQGALVAGFAFISNLWLLKHFLPTHVTVIFLGQPIFGVFFSWLILREPLEATVWLGAALVIFGSWLARRPAHQGGPHVAIQRPRDSTS